MHNQYYAQSTAKSTAKPYKLHLEITVAQNINF